MQEVTTEKALNYSKPLQKLQSANAREMSQSEFSEFFSQALSLVERLSELLERTFQVAVARHVDAVEREKHQVSSEAASSARGLHKADIAGLRSLGASPELIARAETGGRARPRVSLYRTPFARSVEIVEAAGILSSGDPAFDHWKRRRAFELMPHHDRFVHSVVCGELKRAGARGLRGEAARLAAFDETSKALSLGAVLGMKYKSRTAIMLTYRRVEARAAAGRDQVVLPQITADDFRRWMACGRLPSWLA